MTQQRTWTANRLLALCAAMALLAASLGGCRAELLTDPALAAAEVGGNDADATADLGTTAEVAAETAVGPDSVEPEIVEADSIDVAEAAIDAAVPDAESSDDTAQPDADAAPADADAGAEEIALDAADAPSDGAADAMDAMDIAVKDAPNDAVVDAAEVDSGAINPDIAAEVAAEVAEDAGPKLFDCKVLNCDDGNACTLDTCDPVSGCGSGAIGSACLGDSCSKGGCADGVCMVAKKDCNDADACTADYCSNGFCLHTPLPCQKPACNSNAECGNKVCDLFTHTCMMCLSDQKCSPATPICLSGQCTPGTLCTKASECKGSGQLCDVAAGHCVDCLAPSDCTLKPNQTCLAQVCIDKKACGSDNECPCAPGVDCSGVCAKDLGFCVKCNIDSDCDAKYTCGADHACHANVCANGACLGGGFLACNAKGTAYLDGKSCVDASPCTQDSCDPVKGCVYPAVVGSNPACEDGDVCTTPDQCAAGLCKGGGPKNCDDGNPCTIDTCDSLKGCQSSNALAGVVCGEAKTCDGAGECDLKCVRVVTSSLSVDAIALSDITGKTITYAIIGGGGGGGSQAPGSSAIGGGGVFKIGVGNGIAVYVGGGGGGGSGCSGGGGGGSGYFGGGGGTTCSGGGGGSSAIVVANAAALVADGAAGGASPVGPGGGGGSSSGGDGAKDFQLQGAYGKNGSALSGGDAVSPGIYGGAGGIGGGGGGGSYAGGGGGGGLGGGGGGGGNGGDQFQISHNGGSNGADGGNGSQGSGGTGAGNWKDLVKLPNAAGNGGGIYVGGSGGLVILSYSAKTCPL